MAHTIYLVMADTDYQGSTPVKSFVAQWRAKRFKKECEDYEAKRPKPPDEVTVTPENDKAFDDYWAAQKVWEAGHPAGALGASRDQYSIMPIELITSSKRGVMV